MWWIKFLNRLGGGVMSSILEEGEGEIHREQGTAKCDFEKEPWICQTVKRTIPGLMDTVLNIMAVYG